MIKRLGVGLTVLAWLGGVVGFYLQLRTSGLPPSVQTAILVGWIAAGLIVAGIALAHELGRQAGTQRSIGANTGVIHIVQRREADQAMPLSKQIMSSTADIFFMGLSLSKLDSYTGALEDKARAGVHVRLLVPDPLDMDLIRRIARFLGREGPYPRELSWFFNNFLPVWRNAPQYLEVRVHRQLPLFSACMFDGKEGNVEVYGYGIKTDERTVIELDYDGAAAYYRLSLDRVWNEAIPLSSEANFQDRIRTADAVAAASSG